MLMTHCGGESEVYVCDRPCEESTDNGNIGALLAEMQNDTTTLEVCQCLMKVRHTFTMQPSNPTFRYLPKGNENMRLLRDLCANVHSCFTENSPNLETTQMSIGW